MRFSEGSDAARSASSLLCSLSVVRKFREGFQLAFRTPLLNTRKDLAALSRRDQVSRKWSLLLDDPDLDLGVHVGVQPDRHAVDSERANRLVEIYLALLHLKPLRLELVGNVG